jgi:hypothetical protein
VSASATAPATAPTPSGSGTGSDPGRGSGSGTGSGGDSGSGSGGDSRSGSGSGSGRDSGSGGSGSGSGRHSDADVRYVAERLLASVREDLGRADAKAAILLSGAVALVAVLLSARRGGLGADGPADGPASGAAHCAQTVFALFGGLLWAAGLVMLVAVLVPRTRIAADRTFMRDVTSGVSPAVLLPKLTESSTDVVRWTLDQACALGAVLARKYAWLRWGICCLALGAIFTLFSEIWG